MKYLKKYKIFETGEWASDVDWQFVKDNPDDDSEEAGYIRQMERSLTYIKNRLDTEGEIQFEIKNIRGIDLYQGPYATVTINKERFDIYYGDVDGESFLWIEDFPIDNMSEEDMVPGFHGSNDDIVEGIIEYFKPINKEIRRFNL